MRTKEPFRSLFEEARAAERQAAPAPAAAVALPPPATALRPAPLPLAQRLDQVSLAGGTPARGTFVPPLDEGLDGGLDDARTRSPATDDLFAELDDDLFGALDETREPTRPLPAGATIDAALRDSLAELEATAVIPAQRRMTAREVSLVTDASRPGRSAPSVPAPILLKPVAATPAAQVERPRPPPLPAGKAKSTPVPAATRAPPPVLSEAAPAPRMLQLLGEENTLPGLSPAARSSSSDKVVRQSDLYRLQLEFEDTPARPLPRISHVPPPPLPPSSKRSPRRAPAAAPLTDLRDIEAIDDLQAMARALGLDGVGDVSIPSLEGLPELDEHDNTVHEGTVHEDTVHGDTVHGDTVHGDTVHEDPVHQGPVQANTRGSPFEVLDDEPFALTRATSEIRRALVLEALDNSVETVFPERRSRQEGSSAARPALASGKAVTPVIVKIPSRPKVSREARERARRLYLDAVELLGKGERSAAVQHLRSAIEHDDSIPLYRDLLTHLQGSAGVAAERDAPALTVLGPRGQRSQARDLWRSARPR